MEHLGGQYIDAGGAPQQQRRGELPQTEQEHHAGGRDDGGAQQRQRDGEQAPQRRSAAGRGGRLQLLAHVFQAGKDKHIDKRTQQQARDEHDPFDRVNIERPLLQAGQQGQRTQAHVEVTNLGRKQEDPARYRGHCRHNQRQQGGEFTDFAHAPWQQRCTPRQQSAQQHRQHTGQQGQDHRGSHGVADTAQFGHATKRRPAIGERAPLQLEDGPYHREADHQHNQHPAGLRRHFCAQQAATAPPRPLGVNTGVRIHGIDSSFWARKPCMA